jgi:hypothetical protein
MKKPNTYEQNYNILGKKLLQKLQFENINPPSITQ